MLLAVVVLVAAFSRRKQVIAHSREFLISYFFDQKFRVLLEEVSTTSMQLRPNAETTKQPPAKPSGRRCA
jgi:hypothetical protein